MDETAERTFITAERISRIKVRQALAAGATEAVLIEWIRIHERSSTSRTEKLGKKRNRKGQAGSADGYARDASERLLTKSALVGENEIEKSGGG